MSILDSPVKTLSSTQPRLLKLRLITTDGEDRHAMIPCPPTYEEAKISAIEVFQRYMEDSTSSPSNIIIRCAVIDKKGEWVWADIKPRDWKTVMEDFSHEFGVFPLQPHNPFRRGSVFVIFGALNGHKTTWGAVDRYRHVIDRPESYEEGIEYIKSLQASRRDFISDVDLTVQTDVTFCTFTSSLDGYPTTDHWEEFPPLARTDKRVWCALVPAPGQILGFKIKTKKG